MDMKRSTGLQPDILDKKSKSATMVKKLLLNLIYHKSAVLDFQPMYSGNKPNIEHTFPIILLQTANYEKELIWDIGNLRYLGRDENLSKLADPPNVYLRTLNQNELKIHLIPENESLWEIGNYRAFLTERKKMILSRLQEMLKT